MTTKYGLICMAFDGEYVTEKRAQFDSVNDAWEHSSTASGKWFFHPFHFVVSASGLTIKDSPHGLSYLNGKRVKTVCRFFEEVAGMEDAKGMDVESFWFLLRTMEDYYLTFYA